MNFSLALLRAPLGLLVLLAFPQRAVAFCRTTTCDPKASCALEPEDCCIPDDEGCDTNGLPIAWPSACVSYNVQEDGSALLDISATEMQEVVDGAFETWTVVDCAGETVSIALESRGFAECDRPEFSPGKKDRNANIWMFRDDVTREDLQEGDGASLGPLDPIAVAVTTVLFNFKTAEILDVDVEMYSQLANFTLDDDRVDVDLASVVTHEAGHFLGLDHSSQLDATMYFEYAANDSTRRFLSLDDEAGICAAYPEGRTISRDTCEPRGKYHTKCEGQGCDCQLSPGRSLPSPGGWFGAWLLGLIYWARRRRSRALIQ